MAVPPRASLDAETQAFVDAMAASGLPLPPRLSDADARDAFARLQSGPVAKPAVSIEDTTLPGGPGGAVDVRIVRPVVAGPVRPAIVYCHGGGWVLGGRQTHDRLVSELATGVDAAVVLVDYTLAPEACYPVQNEQAYAVLEYVEKNAGALGIDPGRIAVAGDGAGGNMATALTLMAKARRGPRIAFQALLNPVLADISQIGSYEAFADGPWLNKATMEYFLDAYIPDARSRREITAFPLLATPEQLNDLPEALIITAEHDMLRDEGEAYARRLIEAGVTVTTTRYNGTIHDFLVLNGLADTAPARAATAQVIAALRAALGE